MNQHQLIGLAGIFQSARLVHDIATQGDCDDEVASYSLYSIFQFEAPSALSVFGGIDHLRLGLTELKHQLHHPDRQHIEVPRLGVSIILLGSKLLKSKHHMVALRTALETILRDLDLSQFELTNRQLVAQLAETYQQHISQLQPRIIVKGDPTYLQSSLLQERIRALLLASVRSAVLWRQTGGNRLQLLFQRRQMSALLEHLSN